MDAKTRNKALRTANKALAALETYTSDFSAWIEQVREIVTKAGFEIDLSGMFLGESSYCVESAIEEDGKSKLAVRISWHKMPSGRYEMLAYMS